MKTKEITFKIKFNRHQATALFALFFLAWHPAFLGSETLTLTTYYPAPYGGYVSLLTTQQTLLARDAGRVGIGTAAPADKLGIAGGGIDISGGGITIDNGQTIQSRGRLHVTGTELLYILNRSGVVIGREWGGNGNLSVQGDVGVGGSLSGLCTYRTLSTTGWHSTGCAFNETMMGIQHTGWVQEYACAGVGTGTDRDKVCIAGVKWVGLAGRMLCCRISAV